MHKVFAFLISTIFVVIASSMVSAIPPQPSQFWGTAAINGYPAPDGLVVAGTINGVVYSQPSQTIGGFYYLFVKGDDPETPEKEGGVEGEAIIFNVDGHEAIETGVWHSGASVQLDLTITYTPDCIDNDGDGYGYPASPLCTYPEEDCDDSDKDVNPVAAEVCNGIDDNCIDGVDENGDTLCGDGSFCNGQEACAGLAGCQAGTAVDCSANDLPGIATCANNPDNNQFTWDFAASFMSICDEAADSCTTGDPAISHSCDISRCGAECDPTNDCAATDCYYLDSCQGNDYYDYDDVDNNCLGDCSCEDNVCGAPTITSNDPRCVVECQTDGGCGTDGWIGSDYCSGDDVWNTWRTWTCNNPGTSSSSCSYADITQLKEDCADTCEAGVCITSACNSDADCPDDSYSDIYCSANDIYRDLASFTCINPGTPSSECQSSTTPELVEACDDSLYCNGAETCQNAACVEGVPIGCSPYGLPSIATCFNSPDNNPFTWDYFAGFTSTCEEATDSCTTGTASLTHACDIAHCNADCEDDADCDDNNPLTADSCDACQCENILEGECLDDDDCGIDYFTGEPYCSNSDVYGHYVSYICHNPATTSAYCESATSPKLKEKCMDGCSDGKCRQKSITNKDLYIGNLRLDFDGRLHLSTTLENKGRQDLDDLKIAILVYDLGLYYTYGNFDIKEGEKVTKTKALDLPFIEKGVYDARIVVSNDKIRRVIHRELIVD